MQEETIVIKIGTSTIMDPVTKRMSIGNLSTLAETIHSLKTLNYRVVLVSSGAIGVGRDHLEQREKLKGNPPDSLKKTDKSVSAEKELARKQASAAVGQGRLMKVYNDLFAFFDQAVAQVLLTRDDISRRRQCKNACNTFRELLDLDVLPIVNENDTVSSAEIRFGDNDTLSALVAGMVKATWLFLLTDVDALYTANPRTDPSATPLHIVEDIEQLEVNTSGSGSGLGTGGMATKINAATIASSAGCHTVILDGTKPRNVLRIVKGDRSIGTVIMAQTTPMRGHRWWILHNCYVEGTLILDDGAVTAIQERKSLFAAGIVEVHGEFNAQSSVRLVSQTTGEEVGRGTVERTSHEINLLKRHPSSDFAGILGHPVVDEIIHRDNLVVL